jgi:hypothetical protein
MDLEHDERLIAAHAHQGPVAVAAAGMGLTAVLAGGVSPSALLLAPFVALAVALTALWTYRRVHVTDRRVVEFRPALAALARRVPVLARLEVGRRRVIALDDVVAAQPIGTTLVLRTEGNELHHLHVHDEGVAVAFGLQIDELVRRRMLALGRARSISVRVDATAPREAAALRCPYCHDALGEDEPGGAVCDGCGARHHVECFEIHRGCSAGGCGARTARSRAPEVA